MSLTKHFSMLVLFLTFSAQADDLAGILNEVNSFFNQLKEPTVMACTPENVPCTLDPLCKQVAANGDSPFLFKSSTGSIPNFILKEAIASDITDCLNSQNDLLIGSAEWKLQESLKKSDPKNLQAYNKFLSEEYQSLNNNSPSFIESIPHNMGNEEILAAVKKRLPEIKDPKVLKGLTDVIALRRTKIHQLEWKKLLEEKFTPADNLAVMKTVEDVKVTMKKWLGEGGKTYAGSAANETLENLKIVVETVPNSGSSNCDLSDVAYYEPQSNKMVICPRGSTLPAGGLFTVVAHELGHAISPCNPSTNQTPETLNSWNKLNQCLVDPKTGPAPKVATWKDVSSLIQNISDPGMKQQGNELLSYAQNYGTYGCIQNGVAGHLQKIGVEAPLDQTEETHADWVSTELIQLHTQSMKPEDASMFAMEAISPSILKRACDLSKNSLVPKIEAAMKIAGCTQTLTAKSSMLKDEGGDEHMAPDRRFSVHLSTPIIYQSLGCKGAEKGCR